MTNSDIYEEIRKLEETLKSTMKMYDNDVDKMSREQYGGLQFIRGELAVLRTMLKYE